MFISRLKIVNYRSCIDVDVPLGKYSILVGYNNAGKSNILNALDWLLNPAVLAEKDFYDINQDIVVYGVIQNINQSLLDKIDELFLVDKFVFLHFLQTYPFQFDH